MTEADPNQLDQHTPGAKLDAGKPDASLLGQFGRALLAVAEVGTHGAKKYSRGGWKYVPDAVNRYTAAMLRHWLLEDTESSDSKSHLLHAAHLAWNALARLEMILRNQRGIPTFDVRRTLGGEQTDETGKDPRWLDLDRELQKIVHYSGPAVVDPVEPDREVS